MLQALANVNIGSLICNVGAGGPAPAAGVAPAGGPAPATAAAPGRKLGIGGRSVEVNGARGKSLHLLRVDV